jgi:hypothetical protein
VAARDGGIMTAEVAHRLPSRPWADLDRALADVLRPGLAQLVADTGSDISRELPSLGDRRAGAYGRALRVGIESALEHFVDLVGVDEPAADESLTALYEGFGAREDRHGRTLSALLTAYRRGARLAWTQFAGLAVAAGTDTDQLTKLAEAVFAYIDELAAASTVGYARSHSERAAQRNVMRQQLVELLVNGGAETEAARIAELAAESGWPVPDRLAVALVAMEVVAERPVAPVLAADLLQGRVGAEQIAVIPGEALHRGEPRFTPRTGQAVRAFVGTIRPPEEAPVSLAHARSLQRLVATNVLPAKTVVFAQQHLPDLLLHADRRLLADLRDESLAPLDDLAPARRAALLQTLQAWLAHHGERGPTAHELGVHPQTVSYRIAQLEGLLGEALRDPESRFSLQLALRGVSVERDI